VPNLLGYPFAALTAVVSCGFLAVGCVSEPEQPGLQFSPIDPAEGDATGDCGQEACAYTAEVMAADGLTAQLYLSESAFRQGLNDFRIVLSLAEDGGVELAELYALMPAHDHMSEPARIEGNRSSYLVENLALTMPGQWQMTVIADHEKRLEPLTFTIDVQ
jgi:hypothetical protein